LPIARGERDEQITGKRRTGAHALIKRIRRQISVATTCTMRGISSTNARFTH